MMNFKFITRLAAAPVLFFGLALASCNGSNSETNTTTTDSDTLTTTETGANTAEQAGAQATLNATYPDTTLTGTAMFTNDNGKVKLVVNLDVPSRAGQSVAVHIHEHADCGDMGKGAHGHWNPTNKEHGKWGEGNFHLGDIGNVDLDKDGKGSLTMETDLWTIGGDSTSNILDRSIIVHSGVDDFKSQPAGNAGNRIGCGIIQKM